ncbi:hypothetical protein CMV30_11130 [Nibricoccus aquaticus]|uniref:Uncharacterized protein n=1 Tax=Nibricoccus aquaticus TaxID=2576891 RepID=A0A290QKR0_9BACT|nr:hypothetical protein [Nibricoccus aquaticus]ATC64462.1 hypothetical protein CMV30_11130 [Nibricoccus aquaticus]
MTLPDSTRKEMDALPPVLRALLDAELAAGNSIAEIGHGFPAPPVGAFFKLAQPLLSRPRASGEGFTYYNRNSSLYSGEITDSKRFFFLLEPAAPPPPEPNMDDIRAAHTPDDQIPDHEQERTRALKKILLPIAQTKTEDGAHDDTLVGRFRRSMVIDYEKWHDGVGYDLDLIKAASRDERAEIERILIGRDASDWRDVEALAALNSTAAQKALTEALNSSKPEIAVAVMNYAPELVPEATRIRTLVSALRKANFYGGLSRALEQVETFHPPAIIEELFHGALEREGGVGVHFAAMLMFLHGKAESAFDWSQRPFFLRFNATQRDEREAVFLELCEKIGARAEPFAQKVRGAREKIVEEEKAQAIAAIALVPVFAVEIDAAHERLIYREPGRRATVAYVASRKKGRREIRTNTLSDWIGLGSEPTVLMSAEEKTETLARIADYCRNCHGWLDLKMIG